MQLSPLKPKESVEYSVIQTTLKEISKVLQTKTQPKTARQSNTPMYKAPLQKSSQSPDAQNNYTALN